MHLGAIRYKADLETQAQQILDAAVQLEQAGAQLLVLECITLYELAQKITKT